MGVVVGLDLSLTGTGIAVTGPFTGINLTTVKTTGRKGASVADTAARLLLILQEYRHAVAGEWIDLAVIESPSFGSKHGSAHERGGLWWQVACELYENNVPIATVAPQTRAKYATGSGRAGKGEVIAAIREGYGVEPKNDNEADAFVLAAMGWRHLGDPIDAWLTDEDRLGAMKGAKWPS